MEYPDIRRRVIASFSRSNNSTEEGKEVEKPRENSYFDVAGVRLVKVRGDAGSRNGDA